MHAPKNNVDLTLDCSGLRVAASKASEEPSDTSADTMTANHHLGQINLGLRVPSVRIPEGKFCQGNLSAFSSSATWQILGNMIH